MSWWVYLRKNGVVVDVDHHSEGGTHVLGGCRDAELNVTYNYSECFRLVGLDFRSLNDMVAVDAIPILRDAVEKLGTRRFENYWAPTPGNAGYALSILLLWAEQHPDATFTVS